MTAFGTGMDEVVAPDSPLLAEAAGGVAREATIEGRRTARPLKVFATVVATLVLAALLNADHLVDRAGKKPFGGDRDFWLAVWQPFDDVTTGSTSTARASGSMSPSPARSPTPPSRSRPSRHQSHHRTWTCPYDRRVTARRRRLGGRRRPGRPRPPSRATSSATRPRHSCARPPRTTRSSSSSQATRWPSPSALRSRAWRAPPALSPPIWTHARPAASPARTSSTGPRASPRSSMTSNPTSSS